MKKNKFKKVAQDVILTEIKSLKKLKTSIDNNLFFSIILAKFSAPETPPAGPEKIVEIGFASAI